MTKFEKFSSFIYSTIIYPLGITFIAIIIPVVLEICFGIEVMWLVYTACLCSVIAAVWLMLFLITLAIDMIQSWQEDRCDREENSNERTSY